MSQPGGEKELILGNKQLISLFFIVVALCGVFFAMGYMVRGNSLKGTISTTGDNSAAAADTTVKRQQPEPPRDTSDGPPAETASAEAPPISEAPQVETHAAQDAPQNAPQKTAAPAARDTKPDVQSTPKPEIPEVNATYIQVSALALSDAETMVKTLRAQHLPATIAPSSRENYYRVMVGPYHQTSDVADARAKLKTLGFSNTIVQKQ
jgi:cell division protein FtsN